MIRVLSAIFLLALCGSAAEQPKYPDWPVLPVVPQPMPTVKTEPIPASELPYDRLYVVQSDEDIQLLSSPEGRVSIDAHKGPFAINGVFVDGKGKRETRIYEKKQVFLVERVHDGDVELLMVPKGAVVRRVVTDPQNPIPPPKPKPDPKPTTEKSPWDDAPGLRVLIVYPLRGSLPAEQQAIVSGKRVRDYLDAKTAQDIGGKAYRIWKTGEDVSGTEPGWQRAYATLKGDRWVVIGNAVKWTAEPMPENADKMLELLKRYE